MSAATSWTEAEIETLRRLWAEGLSATLIAKRMGRISRNSVISKVRRLKLPYRPVRERVIAVERGPRRPRRKKQPGDLAPISYATQVKIPVHKFAVRPPRPVREGAPESKRLPLLQLTDSTCKYPDGAWNERAVTFCGNETREGSSWCEFHHRTAFQRGTSWREQRRRAA